MAFLTQRAQASMLPTKPPIAAVALSVEELEWIVGNFTKICVSVKSLDELVAIDLAAHEAGIQSEIITDSGATEFNGIPTVTCLALGPDEASKIDALTGGLPLL